MMYYIIVCREFKTQQVYSFLTPVMPNKSIYDIMQDKYGMIDGKDKRGKLVSWSTINFFPITLRSVVPKISELLKPRFS